MENPSVVPAHIKRPLLPDTTAVSHSPTSTRNRKAGARNLKQHEWALVHQHHLRRIKEHKDTVFVIHGVKHEWRNVHRKILRANVDQKEISGGTYCMLQQLPSYIELRSPSPELAPSEVPTSFRPQISQPAFEKQSIGSNLQYSEYEIDTAANSFLRELKLTDSFEDFRAQDWYGRAMTEFKFHLAPFGDVRAAKEDTLGAFADRIYFSGYPGRRLSYLEMILVLINNHWFSTSHFLETVFREANEANLEILKWLARKIDIPKFGARALGKAACLNNFKAVDMLLAEDVDINDLVHCPHFTPQCSCNMSVIAYAQLPRFHRERSGASDEMVAHLLARGAETPKGTDTCLVGLLKCVLNQQGVERTFFVSKVQAIVERIHGFANLAFYADFILENCILNWEEDDTCTEGRHQVLTYLLDQGARTSAGSPLAVAIYMGLPEELHRKLLERTENINAYCNEVYYDENWNRAARKSGGYHSVTTVTPLQAAALRGNDSMMRILLDKGADVNCRARGAGGVTALQAICYLGQDRTQDRAKIIRLFNLLLDYGANVNAAPACMNGLTALQVAAFVGDTQLVGLLVSRGADVNAPGCQWGGGTALEFAAKEAHVDMVRFLLKLGAVVYVDIVKTTHEVALCRELSRLLRISVGELLAMGVVNNSPPRNYCEYETECSSYEKY